MLSNFGEREAPEGGEGWQSLIFTARPDGRSAAATRLRGDLPRVPRSPERTSGRLAARQSRPGLRRRASLGGRPAGRTTGGRAHERRPAAAARGADAIRDGAIRKGEDPALVDRALELDAERRRLLAESETLKAERNAASKRIGEAIKAGAAPGRARRSPTCGPPRPRPVSGSRPSTPPWPRPRPPSTTSSCASRTRPTRTSRSVARRPTSRSGCGASSCRTTSRSSARSAPTPRPAARPGPASRTGSSARRSASSTTPAAPRSPAPASRSTRAPARPSSAASSTGSSTSTPARTG